MTADGLILNAKWKNYNRWQKRKKLRQMATITYNLVEVKVEKLQQITTISNKHVGVKVAKLEQMATFC